MDDATKPAWQQLLETGTLVLFRVLDTHTESALDKENVAVRADLIFTGDEEDIDPADVAEWAAFGFLYTLASLSFTDARPRGYSENEFLPDDQFTVSDFFECLSYRQGGLHLRADYIHGRCMKTDITVRPDGTATLETWGRIFDGYSRSRMLSQLSMMQSYQLLEPEELTCFSESTQEFLAGCMR